MPQFEINCPYCSALYRLEDAMRGCKVQCENCETKFFISEADVAELRSQRQLLGNASPAGGLLLACARSSCRRPNLSSTASLPTTRFKRNICGSRSGSPPPGRQEHRFSRLTTACTFCWRRTTKASPPSVPRFRSIPVGGYGFLRNVSPAWSSLTGRFLSSFERVLMLSIERSLRNYTREENAVDFSSSRSAAG